MADPPFPTAVPKLSPYIADLQSSLLALRQNPYPTVPNPPGCKKRASVALIIRVRPRYPDLATTPDYLPPSPPPVPLTDADSTPTYSNFESRLNAFFSLPWVQRGQPEILFIKRAARHGDRWTSHVALPGGKRDPSDASDEAAAARETLEEVGLDLTSDALNPSWPSSLFAGPLPQRIVTTDFALRPLMVLCPFVYLLTSFDEAQGAPGLRLQPTEVSSAHWVPLEALLDPGVRTYERADIVDRLAGRWGSWLGRVGSEAVRSALRLALGRMLYAGVRLRPSESWWSPDPDSGDEFAKTTVNGSTDATTQHGMLSKLLRILREDIPLPSFPHTCNDSAHEQDPGRRLLLWGLTHGIISDFLGLLPSQTGLTWWRWPTMSRPDIRFVIWVMSYRFRAQKLKALEHPQDISGASDPQLQAPMLIGEGAGTVRQDGAPGFARNGKGEATGVETEARAEREEWKQAKSRATLFSSAAFVLDGYFEQIQRAVWVALALRAVFGTALAMWSLRRFGRRRRY